MTLDSSERARTASELRANLELSGLSLDEVSADVGLPVGDVDAALRSSGSPADVWLLRDYLEQAVGITGRESVPFSVLTEASRAAAEGWFGLREAPLPGRSVR